MFQRGLTCFTLSRLSNLYKYTIHRSWGGIGGGFHFDMHLPHCFWCCQVYSRVVCTEQFASIRRTHRQYHRSRKYGGFTQQNGIWKQDFYPRGIFLSCYHFQMHAYMYGPCLSHYYILNIHIVVVISTGIIKNAYIFHCG